MRRQAITARPDWRDKARAVGFGFHEMYGEPYWVDDACYVFSLDEIEGEIEDPARELHDLCLDLVAAVVESEDLISKLDIPRQHWHLIRNSWRDGERHLYGRFDFAYTGNGAAKLLEYNADTPTSIFESAYFQHNWMMDQIEAVGLPEGTDQFNYLQESLVEAFAAFPKDAIFHFACATDNEEDKGTAAYLMDCAVQAGHSVDIVDINRLGIDAQGRFTDEQSRTVDRCFKLYPWEDMLREPFAQHLKPGVFVEPAWKAILSNKAMLALLWDRNDGHRNLLPTFFEDDARAQSLTTRVRKPFFSREGENVVIATGDEVVEQAGGDYGDGACVVQAFSPLFETAGQHAVLGAWIIGDRAAGLGVREDTSRITRNLSRFVPHVIEAA